MTFRERVIFLNIDVVWGKNVVEWVDLAKGLGNVMLLTTRNQYMYHE
jgi:hypothetical protein